MNKLKNHQILLMTSRMGSVADNTSGASYGYRMSKAALNIAGKSLALDLKPKGIAVCILHPGFVQTGDMTCDWMNLSRRWIGPFTHSHVYISTNDRHDQALLGGRRHHLY